MVSNKAKNYYPRRLEDWYARKIKNCVKAWYRQAYFYLKININHLISGGNTFLSDDDKSKVSKVLTADQINRVLDMMVQSLDKDQNAYTYQGFAKRFVQAIDKFSYKGIKKTTAIKGINPIEDNQQLEAYIKTKIAENVSLIKKMQTTYFHQLRDDIYYSITHGGGVKDIAVKLRDRTEMSENHADLIANDQTGTIVSQLNEYRATHAGFTKYVWHSMEDGRVRPLHQELDGRTFRVDDPDGGDGGDLPGEPIRCRCYAEYLD